MEIFLKGIIAALLVAAFILAVIGLQSLDAGDDDRAPEDAGRRRRTPCPARSAVLRLAGTHHQDGDRAGPPRGDVRLRRRDVSTAVGGSAQRGAVDHASDVLLPAGPDGRRVQGDPARAGGGGGEVFFLRDAFGSGTLKKEYIEELERGGIAVATFRPTRWYQLFKVYHRSHIRVAVIDGIVGYTGGYGIDDKWYGDGRHEDQWRDTTTRFTGPAVLQLQATFAAGWAEATGTLLAGDLFFPPEGKHSHDGDVSAGLLHASPSVGSTSAERYYALAIGSAQQRLWISNAYFVPSENFCELLASAVQRGVDVRVLTCNEDGDVLSTYYAGRAMLCDAARSRASASSSTSRR